MLTERIARRMVARAYRGLRSGDPAPALGAFAASGRFRFAGEHAWQVDTTDPEERKAWFQRFAARRPEMTIHDVLVAGPPWRMRMCVIFDDQVRDPDGAIVYRNHGIQYVLLRWGRITHDEVNLDTQRVAEFGRLGAASIRGRVKGPGR